LVRVKFNKLWALLLHKGLGIGRTTGFGDDGCPGATSPVLAPEAKRERAESLLWTTTQKGEREGWGFGCGLN